MKPSLTAKLSRWLPRRNAGGLRPAVHQKLRTFRPRIEALEDRTVPTTFTVTNLGDAGIGSGTSGDLRYCVNQSNNDTSGNTINFAAGLSGTINLTQGHLDLLTNVTINGPGAAVITVAGNSTSDVFFCESLSHTVNLHTIIGLTITGGRGTTAVNGGGISNNTGFLNLTDCVITNNSATTGGGILNSIDGHLFITDCTISNNTASGDGGGIWNIGGSVDILSSTISINSAGGNGGGIVNFQAGRLSISDSTIVGNESNGFAGGLWNYSGNLTLSSCTIAGNNATDAGGILNDGSMTAINTIIAYNASYGSQDIEGSMTSQGHNLISDSYGGSGFVASDILDVNPLLGYLGNYGGSTATIPLLPGSPALDAGDNSSASSYGDQRHHSRIVNGTIDIGAFESTGFTLSVVSGNNQSANIMTAFAQPLVVQVTANYAAEPVVGGKITFAAPTSGAGTMPAVTRATVLANARASASVTANAVAGDYTVVARTSTGGGTASFSLSNHPLVTTLVDETNPNDGVVSLREALAAFNSAGGDWTVTFAPSLFTHGAATITLNSANGPLVDADTTGILTIQGPGATKLAISGGDAIEVFDVASGAAAVLDGLTISHGHATYGGGILNNGTLTLENSTLSKNVATADGGGIYNTGSVTITNCVLSGNSALDGAAICSSNAYLNQAITVSDSTISGNSASQGIGGGIYFQGSTLTIDRSTIAGNTAADGGGLFLRNGSSAISNSTIKGNTAAGDYGAQCGGGINVNFTAQLTVANSTFSGNSAAQGGAIWDSSVDGTSPAMTVKSCTLSGNSATDAGGGIWNNNRFPLALNLFDTIVAGNTAPNGADIAGLVDSAGHNLIGNSAGASGFIASDLLDVSPLLSALGNYGGPTQTFALLPGSPAIDAGDSTGAPAQDQRGDNRVGAVDIGAFESQGFSLSLVSGNNQITLTNTPFANPLVVRAIANNSSEPVAGGRVTLMAPSTGASTNPAVVTATIAGNGQASATEWANSTAGNYTVTASARGATGAPAFNLSNAGMVTTLLDETDPSDGVYSLREAVAAVNRAGGDHTITFDPSLFTGGAATITLNSANGPLTDSDTTGTVTIAGPGADILAISGGDATQVFIVTYYSASAVLDGLTISGGRATYGGGIDNEGTLTVENCTLSHNVATYGGGILNAGILTVSNTTLSGNNARSLGGGIYSAGNLTVYSSTISGNSAGDGGGVFANNGYITITNSTFAGNTAAGPNGNDAGGGIHVELYASLVVTNTTFAGNSAAKGGAIWDGSSQTLFISNSTLSGNSASEAGGGIWHTSGTFPPLYLFDTIVAGNLASNGPDIAGHVNSTGYNLIGNSSGGSGFTASDLLNVNPLLAPLGDYGGPTQTFALLPGSPAIDAGFLRDAPRTDQRGHNRVVNSAIDIGAFESSGFTMAMVSGNNQVATTGTVFAAPLVVGLRAKDIAEPVAGGRVTLTAPSTGASTNPAVVTATIGSNGQASASETANSSEGYYSVAASAKGATPTVNFSLANSPVIVISPTTLPDATAGVTYSQSLAASGGIGPYTYTVTGGSLPPGFSLSSDGVLSGSNTTATTYTFTVTAIDADGFSGNEAYSLTIDPAATSQFVVAGFPSPITAGVAGNFTVTAEDAYGNFTPGYIGTVHFTSSDLQAALPGDAALNNGVGTFSATLKTAGSQLLTATDSANSSITGSQTGIVVNPAAAKSFTLAGFPSPTTAGVAGSFTVTAKDDCGNVATGYSGTVHFTSSDGQATLPGNSTLTNGVGSFSATLRTAGSQSITATDTADSSIKGSQSGIVVNPAATSSFVVSGFPSPTTAGVAGSFTVTAKDAYGNTTPAYSGMVHFTSSDGQAALPANSTLTNGVGTFSATLKTAGRQSITATDMANSSITGSQAGIQVNPNVAASLVVTGPSSVQSGVAFSLTVMAYDAYGNVATGYRGTIAFRCDDNNAVLPRSYTFTAADAGVHTFTGVSLKKRGTQSITVTDTVNRLLTYTWYVNVL